jgi:hypothetical protein
MSPENNYNTKKLMLVTMLIKAWYSDPISKHEKRRLYEGGPGSDADAASWTVSPTEVD